MNPLADLWLAIRCWYWEHFVAAVARKGGIHTRDYRGSLWTLQEIRKEMRRRGMA